MSIEKLYLKKTPLEHVLHRPDAYVGSVTPNPATLWLLDGVCFAKKEVELPAGLYKIFDEVLVNAADNHIRDKATNSIKVQIENDHVSVWNNGPGIPIQIHKEYKVYVPEMVFGHLLTSSSYNDDEVKLTGGRNGYGAKLANIFSTRFEIQTADKKNGKKFTMRWTDNMQKAHPFELAPFSGQQYTKVTFWPDFARFGLTQLSQDLVNLFKRRVYDLAGSLGPRVKVYLNGLHIKENTFLAYASLYSSDKFERSEQPRWDVLLGCSRSGQFEQVSFVNGIATSRGGTHLNSVVSKLVEFIAEEAGKKSSAKVPNALVKSKLMVLLNCLIENPTFSSQMKDELTTKESKFGSSFQLTAEFKKQIKKSSIVESVVQALKSKEIKTVSRKLAGKKVVRLLGIPKLDDANLAGCEQGCTLILTEGDSAKALAMAGLEVVGRDKFGVFPLRGKILNVRESQLTAIGQNVEIGHLVKIIGLQLGKSYESLATLRYSKVLVMADQDVDGSHIKGLILNMFHSLWPSLLARPGFLSFFVTPLIKATSGSGEQQSFFSAQDYRKWAQERERRGWAIKYYKGLGTSTASEGKQYFRQLQRHTVDLHYAKDRDESAIELAFAKKNSDLRKDWLAHYDSECALEYPMKNVTVREFINKELVHFSNSDNVRSIPSVMDGFKPGQRKVLYASFKRNLVRELKVAQLAGYVAEHAAYHHGEQSLCSTIVGMAQDFVGSNNIPLLQPIGCFGTRHMGGKDAASPRYIFTQLSPMARLLFNQSDDHVVEYLEEEGQTIEPRFYLPIIPMILVNGAEGIGTGWSTSIPCYDPAQLANYILLKLEDKPGIPLRPWWKGWRGTIQQQGGSFSIKGKYEQLQQNDIQVSELPIGRWTKDYKAFIEEMMAGKDPVVRDLKQYHKDQSVSFVITFGEGKMPDQPVIEKQLKLSASMTLTNMVAFDASGTVRRFASVQQIIDHFVEVRAKYYDKRREYQLSKARRQFQLVQAKRDFVRGVIGGEIRLFQRDKDQIIEDLIRRRIKSLSQLTTVQSTKQKESAEREDDYGFLLSMNVLSFSKGKLAELESQYLDKMRVLDQVEQTSAMQLWRTDLVNFLQVWCGNLKAKEIKKSIFTPPKTVPTRPRKAKKQAQTENTIENRAENKIQNQPAKKEDRRKSKLETPAKQKEVKMVQKLEEKSDEKRWLARGEQLLAKYMEGAVAEQSQLMRRVAVRLGLQDSQRKQAEDKS